MAKCKMAKCKWQSASVKHLDEALATTPPAPPTRGVRDPQALEAEEPRLFGDDVRRAQRGGGPTGQGTVKEGQGKRIPWLIPKPHRDPRPVVPEHWAVMTGRCAAAVSPSSQPSRAELVEHLLHLRRVPRVREQPVGVRADGRHPAKKRGRGARPGGAAPRFALRRGGAGGADFATAPVICGMCDLSIDLRGSLYDAPRTFSGIPHPTLFEAMSQMMEHLNFVDISSQYCGCPHRCVGCLGAADARLPPAQATQRSPVSGAALRSVRLPAAWPRLAPAAFVRPLGGAKGAAIEVPGTPVVAGYLGRSVVGGYHLYCLPGVRSFDSRKGRRAVEARRGSPRLAGDPRPQAMDSPVRCWLGPCPGTVQWNRTKQKQAHAKLTAARIWCAVLVGAFAYSCTMLFPVYHFRERPVLERDGRTDAQCFFFEHDGPISRLAGKRAGEPTLDSEQSRVVITFERQAAEAAEPPALAEARLMPASAGSVETGQGLPRLAREAGSPEPRQGSPEDWARRIPGASREEEREEGVAWGRGARILWRSGLQSMIRTPGVPAAGAPGPPAAAAGGGDAAAAPAHACASDTATIRYRNLELSTSIGKWIWHDKHARMHLGHRECANGSGATGVRQRICNRRARMNPWLRQYCKQGVARPGTRPPGVAAPVVRCLGGGVPAAAGDTPPPAACFGGCLGGCAAAAAAPGCDV
eukprot:gene10178-biopygen9378